MVGDRNSMTYSTAVRLPVLRTDPRRDARGVAGSGTEAPVLWGATRGYPAKGWVQATRFSTRRQASEGRPGGPGYVTVISPDSTLVSGAAGPMFFTGKYELSPFEVSHTSVYRNLPPSTFVLFQ